MEGLEGGWGLENLEWLRVEGRLGGWRVRGLGFALPQLCSCLLLKIQYTPILKQKFPSGCIKNRRPWATGFGDSINDLLDLFKIPGVKT